MPRGSISWEVCPASQELANVRNHYAKFGWYYNNEGYTEKDVSTLCQDDGRSGANAIWPKYAWLRGCWNQQEKRKERHWGLRRCFLCKWCREAHEAKSPANKGASLANKGAGKSPKNSWHACKNADDEATDNKGADDKDTKDKKGADDMDAEDKDTKDKKGADDRDTKDTKGADDMDAEDNACKLKEVQDLIAEVAENHYHVVEAMEKMKVKHEARCKAMEEMIAKVHVRCKAIDEMNVKLEVRVTQTEEKMQSILSHERFVGEATYVVAATKSVPV